jgi:hypothetical protein
LTNDEGFLASPPGYSGRVEKGGGMYIGIGTVLLIVLIILLIVFLA